MLTAAAPSSAGTQMKWFKLHTEARNDAKLRSLSDSQHRVWFNLLCFAAEQEKRGTINDWQDSLLAVEVANGNVEILKGTLQVLVRLRIIACSEKAIIFINFDKRQYSKPSDNREQMRLRKRRQREKEKCHAMSRPCHAPDTDTELISKHIDMEDTSTSILSAFQTRSEPENAAPLPTLSAPDGAVPAEDLVLDGTTLTTPDFYLTKRGRKLTGWKLEAFNEFWKAFAYKKGRAEAADAWLSIPNLTRYQAGRIIDAAAKEAKSRRELIARGQTPKWAQGWITARRWEDWEDAAATNHDPHFNGNQEVDHDPKRRRSDRNDRAEYFESLREAVKRFM